MKIYHIPASSHADDLNPWMGVNNLFQSICEYSLMSSTQLHCLISRLLLAARAVVLCFFTFLNFILDWS